MIFLLRCWIEIKSRLDSFLFKNIRSLKNTKINLEILKEMFILLLTCIYGEVGEWLKPAALKAASPARGSRVRIPPSPFLYKKLYFMKFKYKTKISFTAFVINLVIITGFFYLMFNEYKFKKLELPVAVQAYSNNLKILQEEIPDGSTINVDDIYVDDNLPWIVYYIVQPWDTLSKIALNFWVTVSHIKRINHLRWDVIKPGQKLTITDQNGFIYISKWETVDELAKKFWVKPEDIVESNSLPSENYRFQKQDEVFIPMSDEQYKLWLKSHTKTNNISLVRATPIHLKTRNKNIIKQYRYRPNVYNGFYRGQCTRFVAIKKFPYITKTKQKKLWNWNARLWYSHAKEKWYKVWHTPVIWAIVVFRYAWRKYYYAWHVAVVKTVDWKNKRILVEEMNYLWKYIVTLRRVNMYDKNIVWYIYL